MLCRHDWVGDDECTYCRIEELEAQLAEKDAEIAEIIKAGDMDNEALDLNTNPPSR